MALNIAIIFLLGGFVAYVLRRNLLYERQHQTKAQNRTVVETVTPISRDLLFWQSIRRQKLGRTIKVFIGSALLFVVLITTALMLLLVQARSLSIRLAQEQAKNEKDSAVALAAAAKKRAEEKAERLRKARAENDPFAEFNEGLRPIGDGIEDVGIGFSYSMRSFNTGLSLNLTQILVYPVLVIATLSFLFVPAIASLPFSLFLIATWDHPYSIVLLRPFLRQDTSRALKRLVRKGLAGFGFFYTLADTNIKQHWYVKYPILLGQLSFLQFRVRRIKSRHSVDALCEAMRRRQRRILNWSVSNSKIFPVRCIDEHWKYCVARLIFHADLVLIDLTACKASVLWEIQECERLGMMGKVLFISSDENSDASSKLLVDNNIGCSHEIIVYKDFGKQELREFRVVVASKLSLREPESLHLRKLPLKLRAW
jgi:hypothetical protein